MPPINKLIPGTPTALTPGTAEITKKGNTPVPWPQSQFPIPFNLERFFRMNHATPSSLH